MAVMTIARGNGAIALRDVDRGWVRDVKRAALERDMNLRAFCLVAINAALSRPASESVGAGDKLTAALPRIAAAAKVPMDLRTASTLEGERTVERDEYAQD